MIWATPAVVVRASSPGLATSPATVACASSHWSLESLLVPLLPHPPPPSAPEAPCHGRQCRPWPSPPAGIPEPIIPSPVPEPPPSTEAPSRRRGPLPPVGAPPPGGGPPPTYGGYFPAPAVSLPPHQPEVAPPFEGTAEGDSGEVRGLQLA